jgi:hypothetical protein
MLVGRRQTAASVNQHDRDVRLLERTHGLLDHPLADAFFAAGYAAGVDDQVRYGSEPAKAVLPVAGQAGIICDQRVP